MEQLATLESPFVLAYLASGTIHKPVKLGVHAVGSDRTVATTDFAAAPFVATLYALRDRGALALALKTSKVLFISTHAAEITRTGATVPVEHDAAGRVYAATANARKPEAVVSAWFEGRKVDGPWGQVLQAAFDEAAALGVARPTQHSKLQVLGAVLNQGVLRAEFTERPDVADAVAAFAQRWNAWTAADPELHTHLMKGVSAGIAAMKIPSENDVSPADFSSD